MPSVHGSPVDVKERKQPDGFEVDASSEAASVAVAVAASVAAPPSATSFGAEPLPEPLAVSSAGSFGLAVIVASTVETLPPHAAIKQRTPYFIGAKR